MVRTQKGFTLIELLVVVAIIGILGSVILTALSGARQKGLSTTMKENMRIAATNAEQFYIEHGGYSVGSYNMCAVDQVVGSNLSAIAAQFGGGTPIVGGMGDFWDCGAGPTIFVMYVKIADDQYFCVDSSGSSAKLQANEPGLDCGS